jgi:sigma-B regulation protein RsbU (phosphoserine phosphatase)
MAESPPRSGPARLVVRLQRLPRSFRIAMGFGAIAVLAVIDYFAPPELSFLIFYVAPIFFLVWFVGRQAGFLGAAASGLFWYYEDVMSPHRWPSESTADWNIAVRLLFLVAFVWVVAALKSALERERAAGQERLEHDVRIAGEVQRRLFPPADPAIPGLECHGVCGPAQGVAGDYFDFLPLPERHFGIAVGDVAGKGLPAALLMASLQGALRSLASRNADGLTGLVATLNAQIHSLTSHNRFATLFWGVFDEKRRALSYVNAGHNPPMLLRGNGAIERLWTGGPPLGILGEAASYESGSVTLAPGDLLFIFTDGVTEAANASNDQFGDERLERVLREAAAEPVAEICDSVLAAVTAFEDGQPQNDDITLVAARAR